MITYNEIPCELFSADNGKNGLLLKSSSQGFSEALMERAVSLGFEPLDSIGYLKYLPDDEIFSVMNLPEGSKICHFNGDLCKIISKYEDSEHFILVPCNKRSKSKKAYKLIRPIGALARPVICSCKNVIWVDDCSIPANKQFSIECPVCKAQIIRKRCS